jgi:hypothetical protein
MKNVTDQFSDEEKQHLSYLGSMLGRFNTPEEQELEDILEAMEKSARSGASPNELAKRQEETGPHTITISGPGEAPFEKALRYQPGVRNGRIVRLRMREK